MGCFYLKIDYNMPKLPHLIEGNLFVDDRGFLSFVNDFNFKDIKRFYMVENHEAGFVRAWHGHNFEEKYIFTAQGSALLGAVPISKFEDVPIYKFVLSSTKPQILYMPAGYYNGFKTIDSDTKIIFFSTSTVEESKKDDIRKPWNTWNIWERDYR